MKRASLILFTIYGLLSLSCQRESPGRDPIGKVPVLAGGVYSSLPSGYGTRTSLEDVLDGSLPEQLPLPEGTTLYLMIEVPDEGNPGEWRQDKENYPLKSYVVGGGQSLFPCVVDRYGNCVEQSGSPLMLGEGSYRFHAVSPARLIRDTVINGTEFKDVMPISNGDYVIASDPNWEETEPTVAEVHITTDNDVLPVTLNPLINQTAEMVFNIRMGRNVTKMEILDEGVELTGIQNDASGVAFHWSIGGSELPMKVGDKYYGVKIKDWTETPEGLRGTISILPTDATTNAIFLLFNIAVNDVPTQYMATLNQQYYRSSYRYTYNFLVDVADGVTVATWDNITIRREGDFTEPGEIDYTR